jgi:hypothetical protein
MSWSGIGRAARLLSVALLVLASSAAVGGALAGARAAAEAAPAGENAIPPASDSPAFQPAETPRRHSIAGRVAALQGRYLLVRSLDGGVVRVRVRPQTVIRRAGERIGLDAIQAGDRVLVVGRLNERGVLVARGIRVRPGPPAPPALVPSPAGMSSSPAIGSRSPALPALPGEASPHLLSGTAE